MHGSGRQLGRSEDIDIGCATLFELDVESQNQNLFGFDQILNS